MQPYSRVFPWVLACLAASFVVSANAAGMSATQPAGIRVQSADGGHCKIAAADLAEALQGKNASCNEQMGHVVSLTVRPAHHPVHIVKAIYDYSAWYSRPLDRRSLHYFGQSVY